MGERETRYEHNSKPSSRLCNAREHNSIFHNPPLPRRSTRSLMSLIWNDFHREMGGRGGAFGPTDRVAESKAVSHNPVICGLEMTVIDLKNYTNSRRKRCGELNPARVHPSVEFSLPGKQWRAFKQSSQTSPSSSFPLVVSVITIQAFANCCYYYSFQMQITGISTKP